MNKKVLLIGAVIALPLLVFLWMSFGFNPRVVESPLIGKQASSFRLQSIEGDVYDLAELRGKPVVINFWATYCVPCIQEHPYLTAAARRYQGRVQFLGIIYQDDPALIARFNRQYGVWGPSLVDPEGKVAISYGVFGPPETFFIDGDGRIVDKVIGALPPDHLFGTIESMLEGSSPASTPSS